MWHQDFCFITFTSSCLTTSLENQFTLVGLPHKHAKQTNKETTKQHEQKQQRTTVGMVSPKMFQTKKNDYLNNKVLRARPPEDQTDVTHGISPISLKLSQIIRFTKIFKTPKWFGLSPYPWAISASHLVSQGKTQKSPPQKCTNRRPLSNSQN